MPKKILELILKTLAKLTLKRYKPKIIAITGNVGKTSTKNAIEAVLSSRYYTRATAGNLNNQLGVPLTILGDYSKKYYSKGGDWKFWLEVIFKSKLNLLIPQKYPKFLILEFGADRPGDIERLCREYKPDVGVVTAVGQIPSHVEFFGSQKELANEKSRIIQNLLPENFAILNFDDESVRSMSAKTKAKVVTYGFEKEATVSISNFSMTLDEENKPQGINFKLNHENNSVSVKIDGVLGHSQALAVAGGMAVGLALGIDLSNIALSLERYSLAPSRLRILKGVKNTTIIDDSYNSSPIAAKLALETIKIIPAKRKIAILGDMLELGQYTEPAHREIGALAAGVCDLVIFIGEKSKFAKDSAMAVMSEEKIMWFADSEEAKIKVQEIIEEGDLILIKGSQGMRMEKITKEIMAEPELARILLCRQSEGWLKK